MYERDASFGAWSLPIPPYHAEREERTLPLVLPAQRKAASLVRPRAAGGGADGSSKRGSARRRAPTRHLRTFPMPSTTLIEAPALKIFMNFVNTSPLYRMSTPYMGLEEHRRSRPL